MPFDSPCPGIDTTTPVFLGDCDQTCNKRGHRAIVAQKAWHGRFGYNREICTTAAASPDTVKYLSKSIHIRIDSGSNVGSTYWDGTAMVNCTTSTESFHVKREGIASVDRHSGVKSITGCIDTRDYANTPDCPGATSANAPFKDITCIGGGGSSYTLPWADILMTLEACGGSIGTSAGGGTGCGNFFGGTPAAIMAYFGGVGFNNTTTDSGPGFSSTYTNTGSATVTLSDDHIEVEISQSWSVTAHIDDDGTGHPLDYSGGGSGIAYVSIQLYNAYSYADVNSDAYSLLGMRSLTDFTNYGWHHGCTYPLVHYDEAGASTPEDVTMTPCSPAYVDPVASAPYGYSGHGYTGAIINGSGPIVDWFTVPIGYMLDGGGADYMFGTSQSLTVVKYAEIVLKRPAHRWARPAGASDRALLQDDLVTPRYPTAFAMCGRYTVSSVTQTGTSVDIVIAPPSLASGELPLPAWPAAGIKVGDVILFTGVTGLGAETVVTVVDPASEFTITHVPVLAPYVSGGTCIDNAAATAGAGGSTVADVWGHATPNGDYVFLKYAFNERTRTITPPYICASPYGWPWDVTALSVTQGSLNDFTKTRVVSVSPDGSEDWNSISGYQGTSYAFDAAAMPLSLDERYGSRWCAQVQQRMPDPIDFAVNVEAVASVPTGAGTRALTIAGGCSFFSSTYRCGYVQIYNATDAYNLQGTGCHDTPHCGPTCDEPVKLLTPPLADCYAFDDDIP